MAKSQRARGTSHLPAFMDNCLLATRVYPIQLVDESVLVFYVPLWIGLICGGSVDVFFGMVSMVLVPWELVLF